MIRMLALSGGVVMAALLPASFGTDPDDSEPATTQERTDGDPATQSPAAGAGDQVEQQGSPSFERELAELAFALYLSTELGLDAGDYACTEPPSLDVAETITCFTMIHSQRVVVVRTHASGASGVFEFELVADFDLADATATTSTTSSSSSPELTTTTALPTPVLVSTSTAALSQVDLDLVSYGDLINQTAERDVENLIADGEGVVEAAEYSWDRDSAAVTLDITLGSSYSGTPGTAGTAGSAGTTGTVDTAAWIVARNQAMALWDRGSPFRAEGATIFPQLVVIVDDTRYVSDFELCVQVADQTIAMDDWIEAARQD